MTNTASGWLPDAHRLGRTQGAYLLRIRLDRPTNLPPRFGDRLSAGIYLYAGSAYGPGGLHARGARHLRRAPRRHWHVDWLTSEADALHIFAIAGSTECAIVAALARTGLTFPAPGFGSSDCRRCPSHLLVLPPGDDGNDLLHLLTRERLT